MARPAECQRQHRWRYYAMFAYAFARTPPYAILAATPRFRLNASDAWVAQWRMVLDNRIFSARVSSAAPH